MSRNAPSGRSAHNRSIRNRRQDSLRFRLLRHEQLEDRRLLTAVAPPAGLVSWWTGDNTSADVTERNDPELVAGTGYAAGMVGQAFDFDGVNDRVQLVDSESLKLTESMTIEGWINVRSVPSANNGQIIFRGDDRGGLDPYALYASQAGEIGLHIGALTGAAGLTAPIPWGRFVHVAATLDDATGAMRLYVDGALAKEGVTEVRPFRDLDPASNPSIGIGNHGGYPTSPHNFPFDGLIDELAIYNRALEPDEIYAIFDAGSDGKGQMWVVDSTPGWGDVVDTPPTSFDVEFSHAYAYTNVIDVAAAFQVNGITADAFERKDADTATFSFVSSPVADQSIQQTMHMEAGPVTRASDGLGMAEFDATFRFDVDRMQVASTDPPEGSTFSVPLNTVASASTAILSSAGMDGGNGGWPILYGANAVSSERIQLAIDEDQLLDSERSHTTEQVAFVVFDDDSTSAAPSYLQTGLITGVSSAPDQWTTVTLDHAYTSMVVVATPRYDNGPPLVTRVRNADGNHFEVKLQRTDGLTEEVFADVHFVVVEEGVYDDMEAARIDAPNPNDATDTGDPDFISRTDRAGDGGIYWVGESRSYANAYASPVVLGQVMSCYDSRFSTFWARGPSRWDPPSNSALFVGKHIAEDPDLGDTPKTRARGERTRRLATLFWKAGVGRSTERDTWLGWAQTLSRVSTQIHLTNTRSPSPPCR